MARILLLNSSFFSAVFGLFFLTMFFVFLYFFFRVFTSWHRSGFVAAPSCVKFVSAFDVLLLRKMEAAGLLARWGFTPFFAFSRGRGRQ